MTKEEKMVIARARARKWREDNSERARERDRKYYLRNREKFISRAKEWGAANPVRRKEIISASRDRTRLKNRSLRALQARSARSANLGRARLQGILQAAARRARLNGAGGVISERDAQLLIEAANGFCQYCGCEGKKLTLDHVEPLLHGGKNEIKNLIPVCKSCNSSKWIKPVDEYLNKAHGVPGLATALYFFENGKSMTGEMMGAVWGRT